MPKDMVDYSKQSQGNDEWAKLKNWKDPITGKVPPQTPEGKPTPLGSGVWGPPTDFEGGKG